MNNNDTNKEYENEMYIIKVFKLKSELKLCLVLQGPFTNHSLHCICILQVFKITTNSRKILMLSSKDKTQLMFNTDPYC